MAKYYEIALNATTTCDILVHSAHLGVSARGRFANDAKQFQGPWAPATRHEAAEVLRMARRYEWKVWTYRY